MLPLPVRLAHRLLALDKFGARKAGADGALLSVSQEELAFMLGVSRQSVNRQLKHWEQAGWLRQRYGRIELRDREALAAVDHSGE